MAIPLDELRLRPATAKDGRFLYDLHRTTLREYVEPIWGWDEAWQVAHFHQRFTPEKVSIVSLGDKDVGCISVEDPGDHLFLAYIAILPGCQNLGIGTALVRQVLDEAAQRAIPVRLRVLRTNRARAFYERLGFVVVKTTEERWFMEARPRDVVAVPAMEV